MELESNISLDQKWFKFQLNLINPTNSDATVDFFNANLLANFPSTQYGGTGYPSISNPIISFPSTRFGMDYSIANDLLYIASKSVANIRIINPQTNTVVGSIATPFVPSGYVKYNPINNTMYCMSFVGNIVLVIDCVTNTISTVIPLGGASGTFGVDYSTSENAMYISQPAIDTIKRIDCNTNAVTHTFTFGAGTAPTAVAYNSIKNTVYVLSSGFAFMYELSATNLTLNTTIVLPLLGREASTFCIDKNSVYYQDTSNALIEINCVSNTIVATLAYPNQTRSLIYVSAFSALYISGFRFVLPDRVSVFNVNTNTLVTNVATPITPFGDWGQFAYVTSKNSMYTTIESFGLGNLFELSSVSQFYITGSDIYSNLTRNIFYNPICVRRIYMATSNQIQQMQPFMLLTRDANGQQAIIPRLPNTHISQNQFQAFISMIDFHCKDLILDNNTIFSQYIVKANSEATMVFWYKQIDRIDVLSDKVSMCDREIGYDWGNINYNTEGELELMSNNPFTVKNAEVVVQVLRQQRQAKFMLETN